MTAPLADDDKINPAHYDGDLCMRVIAAITKDYTGATAFCLGTAIKYLWRMGRKDGESASDDRGKALWYLRWDQEHRSRHRPWHRVLWRIFAGDNTDLDLASLRSRLIVLAAMPKPDSDQIHRDLLEMTGTGLKDLPREQLS